MPTVDMQGTKFTFSVLPKKPLAIGASLRVQIEIENEFVRYRNVTKSLRKEDLEEWLTSAFRLLAGAYQRERNLFFENAGLAIDLYPYTEGEGELSRETLRQNDCVMAVRLLLRSSDKKRFYGGAYTFLFHRKEIEEFAKALTAEYEAAGVRRIPGRGKYRFVGVSPLGYTGCYYWYLDETESINAGDYAWVRMGRHNKEQIVYVDGVRRYGDDDAPYDTARVKRVLRKATREEVEKINLTASEDL